jgi:transcriptional regulator with XRE-family HTH domain
MLTVSEKIAVIMNRKNMNYSDLAAATGQTRQNLWNKQQRNNYTVQQLQQIAAALDQTIDFVFIDTATGEQL